MNVWLHAYVRDEEERRETEKVVIPICDWFCVCIAKQTHGT
jgi:hypothetical protein